MTTRDVGHERQFAGGGVINTSMTREKPRFLFVHLQKTGGTALFQRLREHFGPRCVYPTPDEQGDMRAVTDLDFLVDRLRVHGDEVRVVTGHFPLCTNDLLGGGFTTFTVLRDPVERTLSLAAPPPELRKSASRGGP